MTTMELEQAKALRDRGFTLQEIADALNYSAGAIGYWLKDCKRGPRDLVTNCPYKGIRKYFMESRTSISDFSDYMWGCAGKERNSNVRRMLDGANVRFSIEGIKRLSALTGMTFEELFERTDEETKTEKGA